MSFVSVSRQLVPLEHQQLRTHISETNRLGDLSIKWRPLGKAAATLIEQAQYQRVITRASGKLALMDPADVSATLNRTILANMPGGNRQISAEVIDVRFFGDGPFSSIAYVLECPLLTQQRDYITSKLDSLNGINAWWGDNFTPHISVATLPIANEEDSILETFWGFAPTNMTLQRAVAQP